MTRRGFIKLSGITAIALSGCSGDYLGVSDFESKPFSSALSIPPELKGTLVNGKKLYKLNAQDGLSHFFENITTPTRGLNGALLGPTIRVDDGDEVDFEVTNSLNEPLALHWHGMHLPAKMDGNAHQEIASKQKWTSSFTINQKACTNWYHPHTHKKTAQHVYQGMAGFIIINDKESDAIDLPKTYGVDDIPIVIQDRSFNDDGTLFYSAGSGMGMSSMRGMLGDVIIVNGVVNPYLEVPNKEVRLRILNGSNARFYTLKLNNNKSFKQIASDNALLESSVEMSEVKLTTAERAEIVIDFTNDAGKEFILSDIDAGFDILKIKVSKNATSTTKTPSKLIDLSSVIADKTQAVKTRVFELNMRQMRFTINGKLFDKDRIDETINVDEVEIWEIKNLSNMVHNFHMHATHFHIIQRSDREVPLNERGLKDTVFVPPKESVKVVLVMRDYIDSKSPYMYHCHILEHENAGMMGQFVVV